MKNILITGGAGYIGSHVANLLLDKKHKVSIIDSLITGNLNLVPKKSTFYKCDIDDFKNVEKIIKENSFDLVMHFAGLNSVGESIKKPKLYNDNNYKKAKVFLNTCFKNNLTYVIFSSTAAVYGNSKKNIVSENDALNPLNPYAKSKINLENFIINKAKKNKKIKFIILRYFNVAGTDKKMRSGLISKKSNHLIKLAAEVATGKKKFLMINGNDYNTKDGTPVRDFIHVSDLANIHLVSAKYLSNKGKSNIFNCGYGQGYSVKEVVNCLNRILKKKITCKVGPRRNGDIKSIIADTKKFKRTMSWKPKYNNLTYILKTALEWERKLKKQ